MQDYPEISLKCIENEQTLLEFGLDEAAKVFTKKRVPRLFPIFAVFYKGKFAGYFQQVQQVVIYPEMHPSMVEGPDAYVNLVAALATEVKRYCGNPLFLLCDKANSLGSDMLKGMRLKRAPETAYLYDGD